MSEIPQLKDVLIEKTAAFDAARNDYALGGIDAADVIAAIDARENNRPRLAEEDAALFLHNDRIDEYDELARGQFKPIRGFYLSWVEGGEITLSSHPSTDEVRGPELEHVSLTAEIQADGELKIEKVNRVGKEKQELKLTPEDRQTVAEAIVQLGKIQDLLSEL